MQLTAYQAKYFAYDLTRKATGNDRLSMALFDAAVDLNPHQIEAALFALQSPLSKGVILCDEVGLGKTIEAGIVLSQLWAERKRRLLILCPASIRKQWSLELREKFNLPTFVLDSRGYKEAERNSEHPLDRKEIIIASTHYAHRIADEVKSVAWDLVVIDEAHKLRNAYRPSNVIGQSIRWATEGCRKLLLTATPLQNSLLELYGLSTLIDEHIFGDINAFRAQFVGSGGSLVALRDRLREFTQRTLRNQVTEYIRYTERKALTQPFTPSDSEQRLYQAISDFLRRPDSFAIPKRQRHLVHLILYKLLASSSRAIAATLDSMRRRLEDLRDEKLENDIEFVEELVDAEEMEDDLLDEILVDLEIEEQSESETTIIDRKRIADEIHDLQRLSDWANSIETDAKSESLLSALKVGFDRMGSVGANRKALIFTESRRTQDYLKAFLEAHGYKGQVVLFNGTNTSPEASEIYSSWLNAAKDDGRASGSRSIDIRTAIIEYFRDEATILIATEAAAEGVNLQFCSLVINYDLPWNPQRVEQRIGRCHRYGQKHDVVVVNFLNERNLADRRVLQLLEQKFQLFSGVFGASDEILGSIESGVDFEKRILAIYRECRTEQEITEAFDELQEEMEEQITSRMDETRQLLLEHFDEDVHQRLRLRLQDAQAQLDRFGQRFWQLTRHVLEPRARFDESALSFHLDSPPKDYIPAGMYHLISKSRPMDESKQDDDRLGQLDNFLYRLSHPLGEYVLATAKNLSTPLVDVVFDISNHPTRISDVEALKGSSGWLRLSMLSIESYELEEYLLFSAVDEDGNSVDQEACQKLFNCSASVNSATELSPIIDDRLSREADRTKAATLNRSLETNNEYFQVAREKLETWADDMVIAAEKQLHDTKQKIKVLRRQARQAETIDEQHEIQIKIKRLEKLQRKQRQEIFDVEDDIVNRRDNLIDKLESRMSQKTDFQALFTIRWSVV